MAKKKLLVILGALHIEMAMLSCIGDWVQENVWAIALSLSRIAELYLRETIPY